MTEDSAALTYRFLLSPWFALSVVGAADVATTVSGLSRGLAEANPAVAPIIEIGGTPALLALKAGVILVVYLATHGLPDPAPDVTAHLIALIWMFAVGSNLSLNHSTPTEPAATGLLFASIAAAVFGASHYAERNSGQTEADTAMPDTPA